MLGLNCDLQSFRHFQVLSCVVSNVEWQAENSDSVVADYGTYMEFKPSILYQDEPIYQVYHLTSVVFSSILHNVPGVGKLCQAG